MEDGLFKDSLALLFYLFPSRTRHLCLSTFASASLSRPRSSRSGPRQTKTRPSGCNNSARLKPEMRFQYNNSLIQVLQQTVIKKKFESNKLNVV